MLKTRVITAAILLAVFIPTLLFSSNMVWAVGSLMVSLLALYEWAKLIGASHSCTIFYTLFAAFLGAIMLYFIQKNGFHWMLYQAFSAFVIALGFWLLIVPILLTKFIAARNKWLLKLIGLILIAPLWLALMSAKVADPMLLLALLATIWIADSAAYFSGKHFGKHKLAPSISPGKTWEGVFGALVAVFCFWLILYLTGYAGLSSLLLFWLVAIMGVIGDLFESLIKRQMNKKDSGDLLPGHGGILDRIDGLISSLPVALLMIYLFNYYQVAA